MTLRTKLVLAQGPLAVALAIVGALSAVITDRLGDEATEILADNYRSVLAAQRMKEALERLDSLSLFIMAGRATQAQAALDTHTARLEHELRVQEGNITEPGEAAVTARFRTAWAQYRTELERYRRLDGREAWEERYFRVLAPAFLRAKAGAEDILTLNQDAMMRKSERAAALAGRFRALVLAAVLLTALLGLAASISLTARLLRPVGVVAAAVRRFGGGDLNARARVSTRDEVSQLAHEFNTMADRLERYRASSLGELIQAQQSAQAAIDGLPDPVILLDGAGKLSGLNQAATTVLKIDPERPGGDPFSGVDPGIRAALDRFRGHALGGRGPYVPRGFEEAVRLAAPEGERILLPRATPIHGETGEVSGVAVVFQDITRVFRSNELKNNLVATVAHEFRTPLTSLRMAIHLCLDETVGPLTPKQADLLYAARDDCERLQSIVDDLLDLSRIESGRIDLHRRRLTPESLVALALDVHRQAAEDRQTTLRSEILPGCPEVFADPDRLQLVFTNLLSNAIRYSPAGGEIVVSAAVEPPASTSPRAHRLESPGWLRFSVRDAGPGIPGEHAERLFEKFYRVPGSPEGGSGLGLFIAKGIVQAHGGRIGVESTPGKGATFWFTVPVAPDVSAPT